VGNRLRLVEEAGLLEQAGGWLRLSKRGRGDATGQGRVAVLRRLSENG